MKLSFSLFFAVKTNPVECEVCQSAIGYLDSVLTEQSTEDEIKNEVKSLCSQWQLVNDYEVKSLCSHLPAAIDNEVMIFLLFPFVEKLV